jgi:hypothetical protein
MARPQLTYRVEMDCHRGGGMGLAIVFSLEC